jgi:GT2 family glycosyltransferase
MSDAGIWPKIDVPDKKSYPKIGRVSKKAPRPFWSVMIPTYDRCEYLKDTLKSVLSQDPGPQRMQIEVLDNCSPNKGAQKVVKEVGGGRVGFFRQKENVGMANNWTSCVRRATGQWVHILHDDDMARPGFYKAFEQVIERDPKMVMAFCRSAVIDEKGKGKKTAYRPPATAKGSHALKDWSGQIIKWNYLAAPSAVVKRSAYERAGGFDPDLKYTADWDMWIRLSFLGPVGYIGDKPLLSYRVHSGSDTNKLNKSGENLLDIMRTVETNLKMFPEGERGRLRSEIKRINSGFAKTNCHTLNSKHEFGAALRQAVWAFRLWPTPYNLSLVGYDALRAGLQRIAGK